MGGCSLRPRLGPRVQENGPGDPAVTGDNICKHLQTDARRRCQLGRSQIMQSNKERLSPSGSLGEASGGSLQPLVCPSPPRGARGHAGTLPSWAGAAGASLLSTAPSETVQGEGAASLSTQRGTGRDVGASSRSCPSPSSHLRGWWPALCLSEGRLHQCLAPRVNHTNLIISR